MMSIYRKYYIYIIHLFGKFLIPIYFVSLILYREIQDIHSSYNIRDLHFVHVFINFIFINPTYFIYIFIVFTT